MDLEKYGDMMWAAEVQKEVLAEVKAVR